MTSTPFPILPGSVIGVLGSGQLGRMFAIAARQRGYRVHTYSPDTDTPTGQVADKEWSAPYDDLGMAAAFAKGVRVVTFEFENIPVASIETAAKFAPVHPSGNVLHTAQDRLREKIFLSKSGFPVTPFAHIGSIQDLESALETIGTPAVLKTAGFGYDGKGQQRITANKQAKAAYAIFEGVDAVLEQFVDFEKELSVVAARGCDGRFAHYGVMENVHRNCVLDVTIAPALISKTLADRAVEIARGIVEKLDVVGVMCVEMFLTTKGQLLVNELAPRPHNSGHLTIDACVTSQFEQQLRAVCGLPLGSTEPLRPAAMVNLLGDLWKGAGGPNWKRALLHSNVKLHLYGKSEPRPGRKMGHLTALGNTVEEARRIALRAREELSRR